MTSRAFSPTSPPERVGCRLIVGRDAWGVLSPRVSRLIMRTNDQKPRRTDTKKYTRQHREEKRISRDTRSARRITKLPPRPRFARTIRAAKLLSQLGSQDEKLLPWHLTLREEVDIGSWTERCLKSIVFYLRSVNRSLALFDRQRRLLVISGFFGGFALSLAAGGSVLLIGSHADAVRDMSSGVQAAVKIWWQAAPGLLPSEHDRR
jgi:hypothetical protein